MVDTVPFSMNSWAHSAVFSTPASWPFIGKGEACRGSAESSGPECVCRRSDSLLTCPLGRQKGEEKKIADCVGGQAGAVVWSWCWCWG